MEQQLTILYGKDVCVLKYAADFFVFPSTTSSTASSCDTEFSKEDEQRLKDYIQQLKNDRAAVKLTMLELESVHIDPLSYDIKPCADSHRLDLENAVLMQELMAMKVYSRGHLLVPRLYMVLKKSILNLTLLQNIDSGIIWITNSLVHMGGFGHWLVPYCHFFRLND